MGLSGLIGYSAPYRRPLAWLAVMTMASSLIVLAIPWLVGQMLGSIVSGSVAEGPVIGLLVGALFAAALISFAILDKRYSRWVWRQGSAPECVHRP